jgi:hypothetical protein
VSKDVTVRACADTKGDYSSTDGGGQTTKEAMQDFLDVVPDGATITHTSGSVCAEWTEERE